MLFLQKLTYNGFCWSFPDQVATGIDAQEDEEQQGKAPKRTASVTEEGQGDADDRCKTQYHAHIDEDVEEENAQHTIAIDSAELEWLSLRQNDEPEDKG